MNSPLHMHTHTSARICLHDNTTPAPREVIRGRKSQYPATVGVAEGGGPNSYTLYVSSPLSLPFPSLPTPSLLPSFPTCLSHTSFWYCIGKGVADLFCDVLWWRPQGVKLKGPLILPQTVLQNVFPYYWSPFPGRVWSKFSAFHLIIRNYPILISPNWATKQHH